MRKGQNEREALNFRIRHVIRPSPKSWAYFYQRCVGCAVSCGSRCRCAGCSRLGCILSEDRSQRKSRSSPQTLWWGYCAPQMAPYTEELQRNSKSGVWFRCKNYFFRILDGNRNDLYGIYNWLATYIQSHKRVLTFFECGDGDPVRHSAAHVIVRHYTQLIVGIGQ